MGFNMILKRLRNEKGMTQEELARASGLSVHTVSKLEQKNLDPSFSTVQKLASALDVPLEAFVEEKPKQPTPKKRKPRSNGHD